MLRRTKTNEIADNPVWKSHLKTVQAFVVYLDTTQDMNLRVSGIREYEGEEFVVTSEMPYIHRWTRQYKNWVLAKFYQLEKHIEESDCDTVTMLTLTTFHGYNRFGKKSKISSATIPQAFDTLKYGWDKLRDAIKRRGYDYVWIMEPHETGYPHIHVAILGRVSQKDQERIKRLWEKYGCGSYENGAQFSEKAGEDSVKSIRNYLMKYLEKSWYDSDWDTGTLVFNALVWSYGWRFWGSTKGITEIMKRGRPEKLPIDWQTTEIKTSRFSDHAVFWRRENTKLEALVPSDESIKPI